MQNMTLVVKEKKQAVKKESNVHDKQQVVLPRTKAILITGIDKQGEGEPGVMIPWARMSRAGDQVKDAKAYLVALAQDIADVARAIA